LKTELIIDGLNTFIRHFSTNPLMSLYNQPCGAIAGTIGTIYRGVEKYKPDVVTIVWEGGGSSRRRAIYPDYKQGRRPLNLNRSYNEYMEDVNEKDNWEWQLRTLIKILPMMKIGQIYVEDAEADDAIAYLCKWKNKEDVKIIVSTDHDYFQLVNDKTMIWAPRKRLDLYKLNDVVEEFKVHPNNMATVRSFIGDKSDNIQGIGGVQYKKMTRFCPDFKDEKFISVDETIDIIKEHYANPIKFYTYAKRPAKVLDVINCDINLIKRNFQLINLESPQLSATQIDSLNYQHDQPRRMAPKLELMKFMMDQGINNINVDQTGIMLNNTLLTIK
jgi:5'-3' exonuclease